MAIPEAIRVLYERNPLEEVTCQLRFPPILSISNASPVAFQEEVRGEFPYYQHKSIVKFPAGVPSAIAQLMSHDLALGGTTAYTFDSEDRNWTIKLARDGLTLSCRRYTEWSLFQDRLQLAIDSLAKTYRPSFFLHTCVKYKNSIRRSALGLAEDVPWSELIKPWAAGPFASAELASDVKAVQTKCVIRLPGELGRIEATYGLGMHTASKEEVFLIEAHVFNEQKKELADVLLRLDALNRQARFFFRHCITDELHRALRPVTPPNG